MPIVVKNIGPVVYEVVEDDVAMSLCSLHVVLKASVSQLGFTVIICFFALFLLHEN